MNELQDLIRRTGISLRGLSNLTGYNYNSVCKWVNQRQPPGHVLIKLGQYAQAAEDIFDE